MEVMKMGLVLILAQIVMVVLNYAAHVFSLSPWIVFLPTLLFGALWFFAIFTGSKFIIDSFSNIYR
jgi:hypothetical protein